MNREGTHVLRRSEVFLLDFDGPVCSAFAGYPAPSVAADLVKAAESWGVPASTTLKRETDPMEVLKLLYQVAPGSHARAESFLSSAEVRSVAKASPTSGVVSFLEIAHAHRIPVAIVSNNSPESIREFLAQEKLDALVSCVVGREKNDPTLMKPNPHLLNEALYSLDKKPAYGPMVGDSTTDIEAAQSTGCPTVGYANRPDKIHAFRELGADLVVTDMHELAEILNAP